MAHSLPLVAALLSLIGPAVGRPDPPHPQEAPPSDPGAAPPAVASVRSEPLHSPWLRHAAVVLDVEWYGPSLLVTLDARSTVTSWRVDEREVGRSGRLEGVVELATAVDASGDPLGMALVYGGETPRIEFREESDRPPTWSVDGLRGPIGIDPAGRRLAANDGERLLLIDLAAGARGELFELDGLTVTEVRFSDEELAVLMVNRPKLLGRAGTEFEATAVLSVIGTAQRDRRVLESYEEVPTELARLDGAWVALSADGRQLSGQGRQGEPIRLFGAPLLCTGPGGDGLLAIGVDGFLRRAGEEEREGVPLPFVGVGARELERSPDGGTYAVPDGTVVRLVDADGTVSGGAAGPGAPVSALEFDPEGGRLLVASFDHTVRVVELGSGDELAREPTVGIVHSAVFSRAGRDRGFAWVARGGRLERRVAPWPGNSRALSQSAEDPGLPWTDLAASADSLFATLADGTAIRFEGSTLLRKWTEPGLGGPGQVLAVAGDALVLGGDGLLHLDPADGAPRGRLASLGAPVESLALAASGVRGVCGLADGGVLSFTSDGPRIVERVAEHRGRVQALALTADGALVASIGGNDSQLTITRLDEQGRAVGVTLVPHEGAPCTALAWWTAPPSAPSAADAPSAGPDRLLAAGGLDGSIVIHRVEE